VFQRCQVLGSFENYEPSERGGKKYEKVGVGRNTGVHENFVRTKVVCDVGVGEPQSRCSICMKMNRQEKPTGSPGGMQGTERTLTSKRHLGRGEACLFLPLGGECF